MEKFAIKDINVFTENNVNKTKLTIQEKDFDSKDIILEGNGSIKVAVEA